MLRRQIFGPDGGLKTLTVTTDSSSVTTIDANNRKNPLQATKSAATKKLFLNGLEKSEVIVYMGHSRDGGGPSFSPPVLTTAGHVDYEWYHGHRYDRRDMNNALHMSANKSKIVTLLSCSSIRWFSNGVQQNSPQSGLIGTDNDYYAGHFEHGAVILEKIFSYDCLDKLSLDDMQKKSKITTGKKWAVPVKDKKMTPTELKVQAVGNLAKLLSSPILKVRKQAYSEIILFNKKYYTDDAWKRFNAYKFDNFVTDQI